MASSPASTRERSHLLSFYRDLEEMLKEEQATAAKIVTKEELQGEPTASAAEFMVPEPEAASWAALSAVGAGTPRSPETFGAARMRCRPGAGPGPGECLGDARGLWGLRPWPSASGSRAAAQISDEADLSRRRSPAGEGPGARKDTRLYVSWYPFLLGSAEVFGGLRLR
ncbi:unnamed protein product [Rangifer tarandus platyrhynchus]|uniref:Small ribosomal subunit protein uS2 C-terminal domain-containing protein n=1 Tax=Rangifer tarandus platyrhynchus TaxID=3082113 RepID=A0ABN8ZCF6_RANTA|nr:unnamed protein product [Rangifer tarandus platyrhynchus]CAI9688864.1 unnamed protein product [Rangifer tarandus platyrhynchus]